MNEYRHPALLALDQVEDILEAYAEARLAPRGTILARMRVALMSDAAAVAATRAVERRQADEAAAVAPARGRFGLPRITRAHVARPAFSFGFAGLLAFSIGASVTAAPPGSAFYNTRVALESVFLPVEIEARLASHEQHLGERLAEAEAAAARGDAAALAASLTAYQAEIDQTLADVGADFNRLSHFQAVVEAHVAKLTALSLRLPTEVARENAVQHAIQASERVVIKVKAQKVEAVKRPVEPYQPQRPSVRPTLPTSQEQAPPTRP